MSQLCAESEVFQINPDVEPEPVRGMAIRRAMRTVTVSWIFGSVWVTATSGAPFTLFARHLGASEFQIGLLAALPFIASFFTLPASVFTERTGARKKIFLWGLYLQRFLWIPIAFIPLWLFAQGSSAAGGLAVGAFLMLTFLMHCSGAIGGPAWLSWMADIIPSRLRGNYFARRRCWGIASSIPAALIVGWIIDRYAPSGGSNSYAILRTCAFIFAFSALFGIVDIHLFQYVPDVPTPARSSAGFFKMLAQPLRDREFLWFGGFIATLTFAVSFMGQFVTLYLIDKAGVTGTGIQLMLLVAPGLAQLACFSTWGKAVDRLGKKPVLAIASLGLVPVGLGWCLMGHGHVWLGYLLSAAGAALWAGVEVANLNLVLDFSGSREGNSESSGTNYVAVNSIIINIAGCLGGLASGVIASLLRNWHWDPNFLGLSNWSFYEILFAISGMLRLAAVVVFLPRIQEHGAATTAETLRFMTANIYNNLFNAILTPLRLLAPEKEPQRRPETPEPVSLRQAA